MSRIWHMRRQFTFEVLEFAHRKHCTLYASRSICDFRSSCASLLRQRLPSITTITPLVAFFCFFLHPACLANCLRQCRRGSSNSGAWGNQAGQLAACITRRWRRRSVARTRRNSASPTAIFTRRIGIARTIATMAVCRCKRKTCEHFVERFRRPGQLELVQVLRRREDKAGKSGGGDYRLGILGGCGEASDE